MTYEEYHTGATLNESQSVALTTSDKNQLITFSLSQQAQALWKLMQILIYDQRDNAMAVDPSDIKKQAAETTVAHAMARFYHQLRQRVDGMANEQIGELRARANAEIVKDAKKIEEIVMSQIEGLPPIDVFGDNSLL